MKQQTFKTRSGRKQRPRRGFAMVICLGVMAITTAIVVSVLDTEMLEYSALRNTLNYERASYLSAAGVHHALAELEDDFDWRTGIGSTEFPAGSGNTYSATATDGAGSTVVVTGVGTAGGVTRTLSVTVQKD